MCCVSEASDPYVFISSETNAKAVDYLLRVTVCFFVEPGVPEDFLLYSPCGCSGRCVPAYVALGATLPERKPVCELARAVSTITMIESYSQVASAVRGFTNGVCWLKHAQDLLDFS